MSKRREELENEILRVMSKRPFRWMTIWMVKEELTGRHAKAASPAELYLLAKQGYLERRRGDEIPDFIDPKPLTPGSTPRMCYRVTEDGSRLPAQRELKNTSKRAVLRPGLAT